MHPCNFQFKHTRSHTQVHPTLIINALHYCKFVKVNRADPCLSPAAAETQHRPVGCYCVCCSFMRASCYTSTRIISCLYAPGRFTGTSETPGGFLLLQASLTDAVATTPFMWLPRNTLNRQCCTHWQAVITGAPYCVSILKVIQVSVCPNVACTHTWQHRLNLQASIVGIRLNSNFFFNKEEDFSSSVGSHLFSSKPHHMLYQQLFHRL